MVNLLISKLQLFCCVGVASVSVISLPTTIALTAGKSTGEILKPLNDTLKNLKTQAKDKFNSFDKKLNETYTTFGNDVVANAKSGPQTVSAKLQSMSSSANGAAKFANQYATDINYGAFQLGYLIKAVLKHIPTIIKESIVESISGGQDKHLLSVQKIYNIAANEKFGEFISAMSDVVKTYGSSLQNLSNEDTSGIIQIFKEIQNKEKEITRFLGNIKSNADALKNEKDVHSYCATKIMMHVLIGKNSIDSVKETIEKLTAALSSLKEKIKEILQSSNDSSGIDVDTLTNKLNEIKNASEKIKDPCPNGTSN